MPNIGFWDDGLAGTIDRLNAALLQYGDIADRPAPGMQGRAWYSEDEELEYYDTGLAWVPKYSGQSVRFSRFTSSGTWNKSTLDTLVFVMAIGGGGGGGNSATSYLIGGGGGQIHSKLFRASELSNAETVTVGSGGGIGSGGGTSSLSNARARGGSRGSPNINNQSVRDYLEFLIDTQIGRGGQGGADGNNLAGRPGLGLTSLITGGADGTDNSEGTGSGGGGVASGGGNGGDGGVPGGGGGSVRGSGNGGSGGRGEVRVWSW